VRIARNLLLCLLVFWAIFYVSDQFSIEFLPATEAEEPAETSYETTWQCDYCEGTRDGDADVKIAGDLSDCAPGSGCALWFVTDEGKKFTTSCPKCSEEN